MSLLIDSVATEEGRYAIAAKQTKVTLLRQLIEIVAEIAKEEDDEQHP